MKLTSWISTKKHKRAADPYTIAHANRMLSQGNVMSAVSQKVIN